MSKIARAIILAAGRGHQLDGVNKVLIRHPKTGRTILDHAIEAFAGKNVTVVVGFRAIQIMELYPQLDYVLNPEWAVTGNAMKSWLGARRAFDLRRIRGHLLRPPANRGT